MSLQNLTEKFKSFCNSPQKIFLFALFIAACAVVCYTCFFSDIHRDTAYVYAYYTREIGNGNFYNAIVERVPMLNITLGGILAWCGMDTVTALTLIAGIFYLATCFPLRRLLERYLSPLAAAYGCLLYVSAPKLISFGCAPLLESVRIFFLISAVYLFFKTVENPGVKNAILFGVSAGFLSVSRGEGIIASAALLAGLPVFVLLFKKTQSWKKHLAATAIALICAFAAASPFWMMNYIKSGYFVPDMRLVQYGSAIKNALFNSGETAAAPAFMSPEEGNGSWKEKAVSVVSGMIRGGFEIYWLFALTGIVICFCKKRFSPDHLVLVGVTFLQCASYFLVVSSYRYYLFIIPLFMMFTITGAVFFLRLILKYLPEKWHILVLAAGIIFLSCQAAYGIKSAFSRRGKRYKDVGLWIKDYAKIHTPDRKLQIFAPSVAEVAYWSEAGHTDEYGQPLHDPETFREFDLAVVHASFPRGLEKRADLERIPNTPHQDKIWIFRVKPLVNK